MAQIKGKCPQLEKEERFNESWIMEIDLTKEENKQIKENIERFIMTNELELLKAENAELEKKLEEVIDLNIGLNGRIAENINLKKENFKLKKQLEEESCRKKVLGKTFREIEKLWKEATTQLELERGKHRCFTLQEIANKVLDLIKEEQDENATSKIINMIL